MDSSVSGDVIFVSGNKTSFSAVIPLQSRWMGRKVIFAADGGSTCCKFPLSEDGKVRVGDVLAAFDASGVKFVDDDGMLSFLTPNASGLSTDSFTAGATVGIRVIPSAKLSGDEQPSKRHKSSVQTQPLPDLIVDSVLSFKGRDSVMLDLGVRIMHYFEAAVGIGIKREEMLFIVFEGLAGVGKTRCLLETMKAVEKVINSESTLAKLYTRKAVQAVYITFNGSGFGSRHPHYFDPAFESIIQRQGASRAGQLFMQASVVSEIVYGQPWGNLPKELKDEIIEGSTSLSVKKVADHLREGKPLANQLQALYVLVDESQILAQFVLHKGFDGLEFVKGMFSWIALVMTSTQGPCMGKQCNLGIIPLIAGTVVPTVGRWGVSDWLSESRVLAPLDLQSAVEVLQESVNSMQFSEMKQQLEILLEDCSCLPRLILYVVTAWKQVLQNSLPIEDLVHHLRKMVLVFTKSWVDTITKKGNKTIIKRMVRLCLTGAVMETPLDWAEAECRKGYVYAEEVQNGWRYHSPRLLVRSIAERVGVPARSVPILPVVATGSHLEDAFLDNFLAMLCIYEDTSVRVATLFTGAMGNREVLDMVVKVNSGAELVEESHQFYIPSSKRFNYLNDSFIRGLDNHGYYLPPVSTTNTPSFGVLFRCFKNAVATDARVFLLNDKAEVCEFWIQLKGHNHALSKEETEKYCNSALDPKYKVEGRRKIFVLCNAHGFSPDARARDNVLLLDLVHFMPDFLRQVPSNK